MKRISFSELKVWKECPYKHKLVYVDGNRLFKGNIYTAFGTAVHDTCEEILLDNSKDAKKIFLTSFNKQADLLREDGQIIESAIIKEFREQGFNLCEYILPAVEKDFKNYEVIATEEPLLEDIKDFESQNRKFKGFIDLVLRTPDGKIHIIDWKTCSWGWNAQRKTEPMTTYQLTLYKKYYSQKYNVSPENIETYFALLKRTAQKEKVEIFRVSSGDQKTQNALSLLEKAIVNIDNKMYIKNRLSCRYCVFYKTEYCT